MGTGTQELCAQGAAGSRSGERVSDPDWGTGETWGPNTCLLCAVSPKGLSSRPPRCLHAHAEEQAWSKKHRCPRPPP